MFAFNFNSCDLIAHFTYYVSFFFYKRNKFHTNNYKIIFLLNFIKSHLYTLFNVLRWCIFLSLYLKKDKYFNINQKSTVKQLNNVHFGSVDWSAIRMCPHFRGKNIQIRMYQGLKQCPLNRGTCYLAASVMEVLLYYQADPKTVFELKIVKNHLNC